MLLEHADDTPWLSFHRGRKQTSATRREVAVRAKRWAHALEAIGVVPGDRVVVVRANDLDFVASFFGAQLVGAVPVPAPWPFALADASAAAARLWPLIQVADAQVVVTTDRLSDALEALGVRALTEPSATPSEGPPLPKSEDPAFIQFTSGTTSAPRGAVITHTAALANATMMADALGLSSADVGVSWLPLFHDMGLVGALLTSLLRGFPLHVMTPEELLLRPRRWLELISKTRATLTVGPNFAYDLVVRRVRNIDGLELGSLRLALNGSEPVHRRTIEAFEAKLAQSGLREGVVLPVYGLAENCLGVSFAAVSDAAADLPWQGRAVPSVGAPLAGVDVEIRTEAGVVVDEGDEGEIAVRSPSTMAGYFRDPVATEAALRDGWLHTGDLGVIRAGQLYITGRKKDLVIKGGRKYHPYEIERVVAEGLVTTPNGVAAFSVPNADAGTEALVVAIELKGEPDPDLPKLLRGRVVEALGVRPDEIVFVSPGRLPRTTSGKVRRRACSTELFAEAR